MQLTLPYLGAPVGASFSRGIGLWIPPGAKEPGVAGGQAPRVPAGPSPCTQQMWAADRGRGARPTAARPSGGIFHTARSSEEGQGFP